MKSYVFKVALERDKNPGDPDSEAVWRAYIPLLESKGAASWGTTPKEALQSLEDALDMVIEHMIERGEALPQAPSSEVQISQELVVSVTA